MTKKSVATPGIHEVQLPHGFRAIPPACMVLDVLSLKKAITPRMDSLRKEIGTNKAEKLNGFCVGCLPAGKKVYVTVVAKKTSDSENRDSYLCLCLCGASMEAFAISGVFLSRPSQEDFKIKPMLAIPAKRAVVFATK